METKLKVFKIETNELGENCYIVSNGKDAAVIDPGGCAEEIIKKCEGLSVRAVLLTHGHFDHIIAVNDLTKAFSAPVYIHKNDAPCLSDTKKSMAALFGFTHEKTEYDKTYGEGDIVSVGSMNFRVIETPGHSPGSVCLLCGKALFSGDTLFHMTIGRYEPEDEKTIFDSVKKLMKLPGDTRVFPGHGEATEIGFEKEHNPYAALS